MISPYRIAWTRAMGENGVPKQWCLKVLSTHMGNFGRVEEPLVAGCTAGAFVMCFHCTALVWQTAASLSSAAYTVTHPRWHREDWASTTMGAFWVGVWGEQYHLGGEGERRQKHLSPLFAEVSRALWQPSTKKHCWLDCPCKVGAVWVQNILNGACCSGTEHFKQCLLLGPAPTSSHQWEQGSGHLFVWSWSYDFCKLKSSYNLPHKRMLSPVRYVVFQLQRSQFALCAGIDVFKRAQNLLFLVTVVYIEYLEVFL